MQFKASKQIEDEFIASVKRISTFVAILGECGNQEDKLAEVKEDNTNLREEIDVLKTSLTDNGDERIKKIINKTILEKKQAIEKNIKLEAELKKELDSYKCLISEYTHYINHIAYTYADILNYEISKPIADEHFICSKFNKDDFQAFAICLSAVRTQYEKPINLEIEKEPKRYEILKEANKGFDSFIEWLKQN